MKKILDKVLEKGYVVLNGDAELTFSCSRIEMEIETGNVLVGSFRITTEEKYKPEGYVYSSDLRMLIRTAYFGGLDMEIGFQYDSTGLQEGSVSEGVITIVSNLGEYELPYMIQITSSLPVCMLGPVKNLFHFANLSKANWKEALSLFYSKQFSNILNGNDVQYKNIYRGLSGHKGNEINVDHFLEYVRKKSRGDFSVNTEFINLENPTRDITKTIVLNTTNWGHDEIYISAYGDFISTDIDSFLPGTLNDSEENDEDINPEKTQIKVHITRDNLHLGKNAGKIVISNFYKTIEIPVTVNVRNKTKLLVNSLRENRFRLMELYINYRIKAINRAEWLKGCNQIIGTAIVANPDNIEYQLYHIHIMLLEKRFEDAARNIDFARALIETSEYSNEIEAYFNYLSYIASDDSSEMDRLTRENELYYVKDIKNWRLAWLFMQMKDDYINDSFNRMSLLKEQYNAGNNSPVIFLDAIQILNENANIMTELSHFELSLVTFALRKGILSGNIRDRFVFLVSKENAYSDEIFNLLTECYELEDKDDTLVEICSQLMKGNRIGTGYFKWYEKAVDKELRINRLYEYYLMSIDMEYEGTLPKLVLMYFAYRSNLDYERNAFLYANIIRHKREYQEIYSDYESIIKQFAETEILKGRINDNLAFIYEEILGDRLYDPEFASEYAPMLFLNRIKVNRKEFVKLVVVNGYLKEENYYSIYNSQVTLSLVGHNYCIFLEDEYGNRYADESFYEKEYVVKNPKNIDRVMENTSLDLYTALYLAENGKERLTVTKDNEDALVWLSYSDDITEEFRIEIMLTLLEYYFDIDEIGKLDDFLVRFNPAVLEAKDRETCIRILVARGMYDIAFDWIKTYGLEAIDYKILVRLCDRLLMRTDYEYDPQLLKVCQHIFKLGKYDETILNYLIMYDGGLTSELKSLWRAADSFDLDVHSLLETMLVQLLYSGAQVGEEENILNEYISRGANLELEKIFIEKLAYDYFVANRHTDTNVFDRLVYYHQMGENISPYAMLAYLKKSTDAYAKNALGQEERAIVLMFLQYMDQIKIHFPFFMEYRQLWSKLDIYQDRCFIEYHGKEGNKVILHYVIEKNDEEVEEYKKEEMPHMIGGIYVWSYVLFYGEKIRYYITEEESRQEKLTSSSSLEKNEKKTDNADSMFGMINNIVISRDLKDDLTFIHLAEEFSKRRYITNQIFKPYQD